MAPGAKVELTLLETRFMDSLIELSNTIGFIRPEAKEQKLQAERDRLVLEVEALQLENAADKAKLEAFGRLLSSGTGEPAIETEASPVSTFLTPTTPLAIAISSPVPDVTEAIAILKTLVSTPFEQRYPMGREFPALSTCHSLYAICPISAKPKQHFKGRKALV